MAKSEQTKNYQQMSEQLADILAWFESETVDIDQAITKYKEAAKLINKMEEYLKTAENKIKKIKLATK